MGSEVRGCPDRRGEAQGETRSEAQGETRLRYSIMDPTGNITALVEDAVEPACQPVVAAAIMERHPEVEQVGFVQSGSPEGGPAVDAALRMAGGEFCGNATMSAAALLLLRKGQPGPMDDDFVTVQLAVSGAARPVEVRLYQTEKQSFDASILMPDALSVCNRALAFDGVSGQLPVVYMEGISHVIVQPDSAFFWLRDDAPAAERAVRAWCADLGADGLGLMFVEKGTSERHLTPLVYVPAADTVFWENSCASGSAATAMCLAATEGAPCHVALHEPGGTLRVSCDPAGEGTRLYGGARLVAECLL